MLERFNRNTRVLVLDQAWWSANPPGMRWREMKYGVRDIGRRQPARGGVATVSPILVG